MEKNQNTVTRVIELFAGVGGFRLGLEGYGKHKRKGYQTVWSNQWEPSTIKQHASDVYVSRFGKENHSNIDIAKVELKDIPTHDLLVGGFPCQDYSVARTLSQAKGLKGKKGVLWWEIYRILETKKTPYVFLENVDRLLRSPANARGRDFAIMLSSLAKLDYVVEWRVINAAEYGKPQRRKRTFILAYKKGTALEKEMRKPKNEPLAWMLRDGVIATGFPVEHSIEDEYVFHNVGNDPAKISSDFKKIFPDDIHFLNTGMMIDGNVCTVKSEPAFKGKGMTLKDILVTEKEVPQEYYVSKEELKGWEYLKGAKNEKRKTKEGFEYEYTEGSMTFPDNLSNASRTIITAEGGSTPSRFKHLIEPKKGVFRRLTPIELERLCQFPDNHTKLEGVTDSRRAFFMGNALVVGIVEDMGKALLHRINGLTK